MHKVQQIFLTTKTKMAPASNGKKIAKQCVALRESKVLVRRFPFRIQLATQCMVLTPIEQSTAKTISWVQVKHQVRAYYPDSHQAPTDLFAYLDLLKRCVGNQICS